LASNLNHEWCRVKRHTGWGDNLFPIVRVSMPRRGTLNQRGWYDFHAKFQSDPII